MIKLLTNKYIKFAFTVLLIAIPVFTLRAANPDDTAAFQSTAFIQIPGIVTPTVVEIPLTQVFYGRKDFAVQDTNSGVFQPYLFQLKNTAQLTKVIAVSDVLSQGSKQGSDVSLTDGQSNTFIEYSIVDDVAGTVDIRLSADQPVTASSFSVQLGQYVALPTQIALSVTTESGVNQTILASTKMQSQRVTFPETTAKIWNIRFSYSQPLRIEELVLHQKNNTQLSQTLRFLAHPGRSYQIYLDPDRTISIPTSESGDLRSDRDVLVLVAANIYDNPAYVQADTDGDGIVDLIDNCVRVSNPDQEDINNNGRGDVCDDFDRDGVSNAKDNCPDQPNARQADEDFDGIGDVCDGVESRILERYSWLPWAGIMFVAVIVVLLMVRTLRKEE